MEKKFYNIKIDETELCQLTVATIFYCIENEKKGFTMPMTKKLAEKLISIKDNEPFK